jgi:hypothetical protein
VDPWIAQHLRGYNADQLVAIVMHWLDRKPLELRVSGDPLEEDAKVQRLRNLRAGLNRGS